MKSSVRKTKSYAINRILHGILCLHFANYKQASEYLGVEVSTLVDYIINGSMPQIRQKTQMANKLEVPPELLFDLYEISNRQEMKKEGLLPTPPVDDNETPLLYSTKPNILKTKIIQDNDPSRIILLALMISEDMKVIELSQYINRAPHSVTSYIFQHTFPGNKNVHGLLETLFEIDFNKLFYTKQI